MVLRHSRIFYIAAVLVSGIGIGLVASRWPAFREAAVPPAAWPFVVSLVLDVMVGRLAAQGRAAPLTMGDRFLAVLGAGLIVTAMIAWGERG